MLGCGVNVSFMVHFTRLKSGLVHKNVVKHVGNAITVIPLGNVIIFDLGRAVVNPTALLASEDHIFIELY